MSIHPFSILDTRTKEWKERKNWWIILLIKCPMMIHIVNND